MNRLFVYGLLKPGCELHHVLAPFVTRTQPGRVRGRLYDEGVPAAKFGEDGTVEGILAWLEPAAVSVALTVLDDVEDEGRVYGRVMVDVSTGGCVRSAWAYEYLGRVRSPVRGGRWPSGLEG